MFDIAFSELVVVALVALIVIGPERLPGLARKAGEWWGRTQRYVNKVKQDIAHDMAVEEATRLQHDIEKHIAEAEQAMQANGLTLEQSILQAQYKKPDGAAPATPPAAPGETPK
ncbi:Sec-independent protein translocase protein TatB [Sideroxyarcus sp. TK5]|jgi:sec-independent protein translocase protein TatB